jgi:predicted dehydrogenase
MEKKNSRREFIKKVSLATLGISLGGLGMSAASYRRIVGSNDRINIGIIGLGRRLDAYTAAIANKENNINLLYLCDVMKSQREKAALTYSKVLDYTPLLENSIFKVIEDSKVDAVIIATPDHWHTLGTILALTAGKNVYVEKPCSHNPHESELMVQCQKKYNKIVQVGNQQRSAVQSIEIIKEIHNGIIGTPYTAKAFYSNSRGRVVVPKIASVPDGLDWDLFQGPAPRRDYTHDTWNYNWHWYGWDYGTAETGNNALHELDIARWALQVDYPEKVFVDANKNHFIDDGWTMYDTMDATFKFAGNKTIQWDGKSRNDYNTYGASRGTIIYGTEGSVYVDRGGYKLFGRDGKLIKQNLSSGTEGGTQLGGGGDMSTLHIVNFFDSIRGKSEQRSPIDEGAKSMLLCHLANIASRTNEILECNPQNGHITNSTNAMKLWSRDYEKGWEPKF